MIWPVWQNVIPEPMFFEKSRRKRVTTGDLSHGHMSRMQLCLRYCTECAESFSQDTAMCLQCEDERAPLQTDDFDDILAGKIT